MLPFPTFLALFLIFLIAGTTITRANSEDSSFDDDLTNYWKTVTKNQPLPEALQGLLKEDRALEETDHHLLGKFDQKDSNAVHFNYLRYKKGSRLNNVDPEVPGNHFTTTSQKDPNGMHFNYLRYKKDNRLNAGTHFTNTLQKDPNGLHFNYFRYKKDDELNNPDLKVSDNYLTKSFQKDPNDVHFNYLGYKKDSRLNNDGVEVPDNDHLTKIFQKDPNDVHFNYLRYKKDSGLNNIDPKVLGNHFTKVFQKDPNNVHFNYLRYKKDSRLNNDELKVSDNDHLTKAFQKYPNGVHLNYLRYKKDSLENDPNSHHLNYYQYKKDSPLDNVEYGKLLVFTPADLYVGKKFLTIFPYVSTSSSDSQFASPKFLPRHVADSLPFSSAHLPDILRRFGIQPDSPWVKLMEETLKDCEAPGIMGETSFCATSLESMLDSARDTFGSNYETKFISTTHVTETSSTDQRPQKYTLLEAPKEIQAAKKMSCHPMTYLYPVFGCHSVKDSKLFRLLLQGEDGSKVDAIAVCHMDTSKWSPGALFLLAAGLKPGEGTVCHFMQPNHLAIFASSSTSAALLPLPFEQI